MSDEDVQETIEGGEPPLEEDSPEAEAVEEAAEAMAEAEGYPAETADGKTIRIVEKRPDAQAGMISVDSDGNEYTSDEFGWLTPAA